MKNTIKVISNLLIVFFAITLPFVIFPFTITVTVERLTFVPISEFEFPFHLCLYFLLINLVSCAMVFVLYSIGCTNYGITPLYPIFCLFASVFLVVAFLYATVPLLVFGKTKSITWQGRQYTYDKEKDCFAI